MASLPILHSSAIRAVPKGRSVARAAPGHGAAEAAAAQQTVARAALDRPVEAATAVVGGRPRDEAAALLLFLARDEAGGYAPGPVALAHAESASLAYRRQGALPELYAEDPVVFSWRL